MAADKETKLSIVVRTVDKATAKIKEINARLDAATKPMRDFRKALGEFREKSGLDNVIAGFRGVGGALVGVLGKLAAFGGIVGVATAGLFRLVDGFDALGDKAEAAGVSVDFLAQMRFVAEKTGASVDEMDEALLGFNKNLGLARANAGPLVKFLGKVSPTLLKQLKATKSNEEAFDLLANAMAKIPDPARRAALAQKTLGNAALAPTFAKGAKGVKELRDRYFELAGSQQSAADEAGKVDDALKDFKASTDGVKAAIVTGLAPALKVIVERLRDWFQNNRERIAEWAKNVGEKLPGAIKAVADWIGRAFDKVRAFVDMIGGLKGAAVAVAAVIAGPLIASIVSLGGALVTVISRAVQLGKAMKSIPSAPGVGGVGGGGKPGLLGTAANVLVPIAVAKTISDATGGSIVDIAREKGFKSDNVLDLFNEAAEGGPRTSVADVTDRIVQNLNAISQRATEAKVTVDFANAPRGTRVSTDPQSTADVDLSVGYNMLLGTQ